MEKGERMRRRWFFTANRFFGPPFFSKRRRTGKQSAMKTIENSRLHGGSGGWRDFSRAKKQGNSSPALAALLPREGSTTVQLDTRSDRRRETDTPTTMASSSLRSVNPNAEIMSKAAALFMNINAAKGLQDVMKSNLGPKGTIKMLVGGAGGKEVEA
jgi:hypothetical protein